MIEPTWEAARPKAPAHLLAGLPDVPPLVVHLAAWRLRTAPSPNVAGDPEGGWPDAATILEYLFPSVHVPLPSCAIPRMADAAARLVLAVQRRETVGIHGDYDVDGVTSAALLTTWLRGLGLTVETVLPNRQTDGYGLSGGALAALAARGCRLVLAVDCGITAVAEARQSRDMGLELIILDHHQPGPIIPEATLVVDPQLPGADAADHCLAAVGLAYRLCEAMVNAGAGDTCCLAQLLDLVALGTIADVCPLVGQNRLLVARGLTQLRQSKRPGLAALSAAARVRQDRLSTEDVAFRLAPRLNAAGRLDDPRLAYELLLTDDPNRAIVLAGELERLNRERQRLAETALTAALLQIGGPQDMPLLLLANGDDWHPGVVGLVAGKLAERYGRPAIALTATAGGYAGSARSIAGFDIAATLFACRDLLLRSGGHARAAGLALETAALAPLRLRLQRLAAEQLSVEQLQPRLTVEATVRLQSLTPELLRGIDLLGPFGEGNRPPLLQANCLTLAGVNHVGKSRQHAQLRFRQGGTILKGVQFNADATTLPAIGSQVDVLFVPQLDLYDGAERVELRVAAMRSAR